jgi:aminoglycoside phosphotransferase (APT) family kinase protein
VALDDYGDARSARWSEENLLRRPLEALAPFIKRQDKSFLEDAADQLSERLNGLPEGFVHGDIDPGNVHYDGRGGCTLFDYDFCGVGPRAYDLAVFLYEAAWTKWPPSIAQAFLEGYGVEDGYFLERLAPIRGIWFLGLLAQNIDDWGHHELGHFFLERHLALIKQLMADRP